MYVYIYMYTYMYKDMYVYRYTCMDGKAMASRTVYTPDWTKLRGSMDVCTCDFTPTKVMRFLKIRKYIRICITLGSKCDVADSVVFQNSRGSHIVISFYHEM